jgi:hypothetical protein
MGFGPLLFCSVVPYALYADSAAPVAWVQGLALLGVMFLCGLPFMWMFRCFATTAAAHIWLPSIADQDRTLMAGERVFWMVALYTLGWLTAPFFYWTRVHPRTPTATPTATATPRTPTAWSLAVHLADEAPTVVHRIPRTPRFVG